MGLDDIWESIVDLVGGINDFFSNLVDNVAGGGDSPLSHWAYWLGLILYLTALWYLPEKLGMMGYSIRDKIIGSLVFPILEFVIFKKFMD